MTPGRAEEGGERRRFVWPPRPLPPETEAPARSRTAGDGPTASPTPAISPTPTGRAARAAPAPPSPSGDFARPGPLAGIGAALDAFEREWLGRTGVAWRARKRRLGWVADEDACPRCGEPASPAPAPPARADRPAGEAAACTACAETRPHWERFVRVGLYNGPLREAIHDLKFRRWRRVGHELGMELGERLAAAAWAEGIDPRRLVLVPVPMPWWRRMTRGIDHTLTLARGAREVTGAGVVRALARRGWAGLGFRASQTRVAPGRREENVRRAFRVRVGRAAVLRRAVGAGKILVVVDDVRTTGATARSACRTLRRALRTPGGRTRARSAEPNARLRLWMAVLAVAPGRPGTPRAHTPRSGAEARREAGRGAAGQKSEPVRLTNEE